MRKIDYRIQQDGRNYTSYVGGNLLVTPETQHIDVTFTMKSETDEKAKLTFNLGNYSTEKEILMNLKLRLTYTVIYLIVLFA